ncbi:HNH endonuclease signature motif containing protein [Parafrankia sp. FMc2]|uniref:HNH endonuclease signature motif containing protein n=1 Tax=Parafrankia sp. FMc2 TaxID=3233196 RepID=UPI0034D7A405
MPHIDSQSHAQGGHLVVDPMDLFTDQLNARLAAVGDTARQVAASQARMLRALAEAAALQAPREGDPAGIFSDYAPEEVATILAVSGSSARNQMHFAKTVARRLPRALDALEAGEIDLPRLHTLEHSISPLDDDTAAAFEAWMLERGRRRHRAAYAAAARCAVLRLDPAGAERRAEERKKERGVWIEPEDDAVSTLAARLPSDQAEACYRRICALAEGIARDRADDDSRTLDQIRADVLVDIVMGRAEHATPIGCDIQVVVPVTTLLGLGQEPGELAGYGPLPAAVAREIAMRPGSTWRRLLTDPQGALLEVADRRLPSPAQVRHVRARNRQCTHPTCTRPAVRTETDHTVPYADGGPTLTTNLGPCCKRHHRMRHQPGRLWKVRQPRPGVFEWTAPSGATTVTYPHNYLTGEEQLPATDWGMSQ